MAARAAAQPDQELVRALQLALSCATRAVLDRRPSGRTGKVSELFLPEPVRLGRHGDYYLRVAIWFSADAPAHREPHRSNMIGYMIEALNRDHRMLLSYHWHPQGQSHVITPHLHVGCRAGNADLSKIHLPTGPITLIDVVRCAITEFGVQPLRADWRAVLDRVDQTLAHLV